MKYILDTEDGELFTFYDYREAVKYQAIYGGVIIETEQCLTNN